MSLQESEGTVACNQSTSLGEEEEGRNVQGPHHVTTQPHFATTLLQPQKLSNQVHVDIVEEWPYNLVRNDSPGMLEKLHQKVELRKASGLDTWKAVPTPTFQLNLGPCHFTSGFSLKGVT